MMDASLYLDAIQAEVDAELHAENENKQAAAKKQSFFSRTFEDITSNLQT